VCASARGNSESPVPQTPSLARFLASLGAVGEPDASLDWLCRTCATELGVSGVSVSLIRAGHDPGTIASSDERASLLVDLQFGFGEGPSIDAFESRLAVLEPDLARASRWPVHFAAFTLHRDRPGSLGEGVLADALAMAEVASELAPCLQAQSPSGRGPMPSVALWGRWQPTSSPDGSDSTSDPTRALRHGARSRPPIESAMIGREGGTAPHTRR
jgi:hypothetical protein